MVKLILWVDVVTKFQSRALYFSLLRPLSTYELFGKYYTKVSIEDVDQLDFKSLFQLNH